MIEIFKKLFEPAYQFELEQNEIYKNLNDENKAFMNVYEKLSQVSVDTELTTDVYRKIVSLWSGSTVYCKHHFPIESNISGQFVWCDTISPIVAVLLAGNDIIVPISSVKYETYEV